MQREPLKYDGETAVELDRHRTRIRVQQRLGHHTIVQAHDHQLTMAACDPLRHIGRDRQAPGAIARMRDRE